MKKEPFVTKEQLDKINKIYRITKRILLINLVINNTSIIITIY